MPGYLPHHLLECTLLAYNLQQQMAQFRQLCRLCLHSDTVCIQETHSAEACAAAWNPPENFLPFWPHGTKTTTGVLMLKRSTLLKDFNNITPAR